MAGRLYTKSHEWLTVEGKSATVGITDFAQAQLGINRAEINTPECVVLGNPSLESHEVLIPLVHESRPRAPPRN